MFVAYLIDNDSVAHGLGDMEVGTTKEEALAKLKAAWFESLDEDQKDDDPEDAWNECVEDGEAVLGWGTDKQRLFVVERK